ncbi:VIT domain-containing protein [Neisseria sp. Ec49-e6-T10]|uniref:VIT domain-containing protein n=1 Tax=Neisseria sp. Ec49-e6-T10 TaxID=3140744 RepID=UPI003EBA0B83
MSLCRKFAYVFSVLILSYTMQLSAMVMPKTVIEPINIVINNPQAKQHIQLQSVKINGVIIGSVAKTQVEFTLYNPNAIDLEGQLQFPLIAGQTVNGFALDINGQLRDAVAVEKAVGQQVFEDITRTKVDPALLEKNSTNFYKLRVYPIPAKGARTVRLDIVQDLNVVDKKQLVFQFPLMFSEQVQHLQAKFTINQLSEGVDASIGAKALTVSKNKGNSEVLINEKNYKSPSESLQIKVPAYLNKPIISTQEFQGQTYFYAQIPAPQSVHALPRVAPKNIAIIWDASASAQARNHVKELDLLEQYFKKIQNVQVKLLVVRDQAEPIQNFDIIQGNWRELRRTLEKMVYDGATNAEVMRVPDKVDVAFLFTDGLFNFGSGVFPDTNIPLYAMSASAGADDGLLRQLAQKNGGAYLDLLKISLVAALESLQLRQAYVSELSAEGASELNILSPIAENGYYLVTGILNQPRASLHLKIQQPDGTISNSTIELNNEELKQDHFAAAAWASMLVNKLSANTHLNQAQIVRLGKQFGLLTQYTSLIVLDNVSDYVRYEIEPPAELLTEYRQRLADVVQEKKQTQQEHIDRVAQQFKQKQAWWDQKFPKGNIPKININKRKDLAGRGGNEAYEDSTTDIIAQAIEVPATMAEPTDMMEAEAIPPVPTANKAVARQLGLNGNTQQSASIQLKKWTPDEPYIKRLKAAKAEDLYAIYLDEKPSYANSTAFFLDVSDFMFEKGQNQLALRVLSNLAEMNLENRHILRILGYRLLQAKQYPLAIPIFERVKQLSPNEPQSWRDLALALDQAGQKQEAINQLWAVVSTPWHDRFPEVELIALAELNAIVAAAPTSLDVSQIDKRLLRNLPLDLRAILAWDADNTDIDLWVTDPNGEKAYYAHPLTYQGGRMSRDFTGGYGPEEFSLRQAKPGKYIVEAQFYGHNQQIVAPATTLMLTLTTHFGQKNQKDEQVILRLKGAKEKVVVGEFVIK